MCDMVVIITAHLFILYRGSCWWVGGDDLTHRMTKVLSPHISTLNPDSFGWCRKKEQGLHPTETGCSPHDNGWCRKKESNKVFIPLKQDVDLMITVDVRKKESNKFFIPLKQDVHLMIMVDVGKGIEQGLHPTETGCWPHDHIDVTYNIYSIHSIILPHVL